MHAGAVRSVAGSAGRATTLPTTVLMLSGVVDLALRYEQAAPVQAAAVAPDATAASTTA